jgi:N-acyl-L-homoserine lactone synthetase
MRIITGKKEEIPQEFLNGAFKLRYQLFREEGFLPENKEEHDEDEYDDEAFHILALENEEVVGYVRVLNKMLLSEIYGKEVRQIIQLNNLKNPAEVSRLVVKKDYRINKEDSKKRKKFVTALLIKKIFSHGFFNKIDAIFIAVNPRHIERYQKNYSFEIVGSQKDYSRVNGNPAVLLYQKSHIILKTAAKNKIFGKIRFHLEIFSKIMGVSSKFSFSAGPEKNEELKNGKN